MTHHDAFLQAILDDPDDDAVRLIYADWLDEQGGADNAARAEFIRVQCALVHELDDGRRQELTARQQELRARYEEVWAAHMRPLVSEWDFHRGFIDEVRVEARTFLDQADDLFRQAPVQRLRLYWGAVAPHERARHVSVLSECGHLRRLRSLDLRHNYLGSTGAQALAVCPHLTGLTALDLSSNHIGDGGLRALAAMPVMARLASFDLSFNDVGPAGLRDLASALLHLEARGAELLLQTLNLKGNRIGWAGQRVIASSPVLRRVARF
jgi:uncharacterized protein (TIGR02996 family)